MSHVALRRVAIRLLYDPDLVDRLYADPAGALVGVELSPDELTWLTAVPRPAWRTDPDRSRRLMAALHDEFPATLQLAPARATHFFGSPQFHGAIQDRGSVAAAFGSYMAQDSDPRVGALATLEAATAAVRRAPAAVAPSPQGHRRLAAYARVVRVPQGSATLLAAVRCGQAAPELDIELEDLLVLRVRPSTEVTIESLSPELATVLRRAEAGASVEELVRVACALGAEDDEATGLIAQLDDDAVLV